MSTQQDIYADGSKNRPPMLNKDNYVPWSGRLLRYAKSKPNGKMLVNSILHGPYVIRMIVEPGDPDLNVPVAESFHEQTGDELTEKEAKQMKPDDQAIQIILMGLPVETSYHYCSSNEGIAYHRLYSAIAQPGMNMGQERQMMMIGGNQNRYNVVHNVGNQVGQNAVQNLSIQNVGNQNGLLIVLWIANQTANQNGNDNIVSAHVEGNGNNGNQIRCYNYRGLGNYARNCTVRPRKGCYLYLDSVVDCSRGRSRDPTLS
ncbi:hypothetical protein Tco_0753818 [Tanacetum coccineum]